MTIKAIPEKCLWNEIHVPDISHVVDSEDCDEFDVLIIGAGYSGLWTAFYLHLNDTSLRIAIIEKNTVGFGASGRNGGWCSTIMPMSLDSIAHRYGRDQAIALQNAMFATLDEIKYRTTALGIDCDFTQGGSIQVLRSVNQVERAASRIRNLRESGYGEDFYQLLDREESLNLVQMSKTSGGFLDMHSAVLHPKKLCVGLAAAVRAQGTVIIENSPVLSYTPGQVQTQQHTYKAKVVLRTTEAFSSSFSQAQRSVIPLYSMMVATEPLSTDIWSEIGLDSSPSFNDGRNMVIYGQRTADNRLAFGGRGAPYNFGSKILPSYDFNQMVAQGLRSTLIELFPVLERTEFTHHWGGPLAAPRDWTFNISYDPLSGLGSAGGYVGDGVATSNLAGRTLADLVCERSTEETRLSCVNHFSKKWEIEPLRFVAVNSLTKLAMLADWKEDKTGRPASIINGIIDKISGG